MMLNYALAHWISLGLVAATTAAIYRNNEYAVVLLIIYVPAIVVPITISIIVGFLTKKHRFARHVLTFAASAIPLYGFASTDISNKFGALPAALLIITGLCSYIFVLAPRQTISLARHLLTTGRYLAGPGGGAGSGLSRENSGFAAVLNDAALDRSLATGKLLVISGMAAGTVILVALAGAAGVWELGGGGKLSTMDVVIALVMPAEGLFAGAALVTVLDLLVAGRWQRFFGILWVVAVWGLACQAMAPQLGALQGLLASSPSLPAGVILFLWLWNRAVEAQQERAG